MALVESTDPSSVKAIGPLFLYSSQTTNEWGRRAKVYALRAAL